MALEVVGSTLSKGILSRVLLRFFLFSIAFGMRCHPQNLTGICLRGSRSNSIHKEKQVKGYCG